MNTALKRRQHLEWIFPPKIPEKMQKTSKKREESQTKNVPKSGKSPKGGGRISAEDQKVQNSKY